MHRQIAGKLTGPVTKWVVLGAWIVLFMGARLPERQARRRPEQRGVDVAPAVGGVDQGGRRALRDGQPQRHPDPGRLLPRGRPHRGRPRRDRGAGPGDRPDRRRDRRGRAHPCGRRPDPGPAVRPASPRTARSRSARFVFNFGEDGWNDIPHARRRDPRHRRRSTASTVHLAGFGGQAADSAEAFEGIDTTLVLATLLVVIVILLLTYRSPILWLLPIISVVVAYSVSGGVVYLLAKYADLTVNGQSQAILPHPGDRRRHRLRPAARRPIPRGAAPPRRPARGDGLRAAPRGARRILASAATVAVGHAVPARSPTSTRPPASARSSRSAIAVTFLVMVTLLPALLVIFGRWIFWPKRPAFGSAEPNTDRLLGAGRQPDRAAAAPGVDRHRRAAGRVLPRPVPARRRRPVDRGHLHQGVRLDQGPEDPGRARPAGQLQHRAGRDQRRPGRRRSWRRSSDVDGLGDATEPQHDLGRPGLLRGHHRRGHLLDGGLRHRRGDPRRGPRRRRGRRAGRWRLGVLPRHQDRLDPRQQGDHPARPGGGVPDPGAACCGRSSRR